MMLLEGVKVGLYNGSLLNLISYVKLFRALHGLLTSIKLKTKDHSRVLFKEVI